MNHIIVIQPGSQYLRIGRASDPFPVVIPHCIARRHKTPGQKRYDDPWLVRKECQVITVLIILLNMVIK